MQVKVLGRNLHISAQKFRLVAALVREENVEDAVKVLKLTRKKAAVLLLDILKSAVANASNNYGLSEDNLYIKTILVDEGRTNKRWRARAKGSADQIFKRTSNVSLVIDEKKPTAEKDLKKNIINKKKVDDKKKQGRVKQEEQEMKKQKSAQLDPKKLSTSDSDNKEKLSDFKQKDSNRDKQKHQKGFLDKFFRRKAE